MDESVGGINVCVELLGGGPLERPFQLAINTIDGTATGLYLLIRVYLSAFLSLWNCLVQEVQTMKC